MILSLYILSGVNLVFFIALIVIILKLRNIGSVFDELIINFVKHNQEFYKHQERIFKNEKENFEELNKALTEADQLKRNVSRLENIIKSTFSEFSNLKTTTSDLSDLVKTSEKQSARLMDFINNLKIINNVANNLKVCLKTVDKK
jgi:predicted nuclease with TOPRIM domain